MSLTKNQLFGSSAGSDLQAINLRKNFPVTRISKKVIFGEWHHWKFVTSFTILMVWKLGQSTLLVKVDFKGLTSAVAFVDFFMSVMAFTPKLTVASLTSLATFKANSKLKNAPNQADNFTNFSVMSFTENQLFGSSAGSDLQAISQL